MPLPRYLNENQRIPRVEEEIARGGETGKQQRARKLGRHEEKLERVVRRDPTSVVYKPAHSEKRLGQRGIDAVILFGVECLVQRGIVIRAE